MFYSAIIRIAALWNKKAKLWVEGRIGIVEKIKSIKRHNCEIIWVHCSSLGEFEQGRPLIEKLKKQYPPYNILLTFFSPSGYEIRKNYDGAAWVFYLPMDSARNAIELFDILEPRMMILVKYDYWFYYITECKKRNIPLLMISAIFNKRQSFFKWYGNLHRKMLDSFTHIFVQDDHSKKLLESLNANNVSVAGDTRFDRVSEIADNFQPLPLIESFTQNARVLVAGSTWPDDEKIILTATKNFPDLKLIIAPHEIHKEHLDQLRYLFPEAVLYSELVNGLSPKSNQLIIDNIGMLSKLYYYSTIAFVGGGFNKGIHNTIEAAVFGNPVIFGPNYKKFREAIGLIENKGGISINNSEEFSEALALLLNNESELKERSESSRQFVMENKGATEKIISFIQANRLLTS